MRWFLSLARTIAFRKLSHTISSRYEKTSFPFLWGFLAGFTLSTQLPLRRFENMNTPSLLIPVAFALEEKDNKSRTQTMNFIADAVEIAAPAVVHIEVSTQHNRRQFATAVSSGSGFIVTSDGMVLTNAHVVSNSPEVEVRLSSGEIVNGIVVDVDEEADLAAIKIMDSSKKQFPHLVLASSSKVRAGEWVAALGSPLRLSNTVTSGIVSCLHRASGDLGLRKDNVYIQTDAPINVGNSGGPLINLLILGGIVGVLVQQIHLASRKDGEVVGINCITVQQAAGISFAIPSNVAAEFLEGAISKEKRFAKEGYSTSNRGKLNQQFYIGISMLTLSLPIVRELQQRNPELFSAVTGGVLVARVSPGSPSERSGLTVRDVIISINGKQVKTATDVYKEVRKGENMVLKVQRGNSIVTLNIEPEIRSRL